MSLSQMLSLFIAVILMPVFSNAGDDQSFDVEYVPIKKLEYELHYDKPIIKLSEKHHQFDNIYFVIDNEKYYLNRMNFSTPDGFCAALGYQSSSEKSYSKNSYMSSRYIPGFENIISFSRAGHITGTASKAGVWIKSVTCYSPGYQEKIRLSREINKALDRGDVAKARELMGKREELGFQ